MTFGMTSRGSRQTGRPAHESARLVFFGNERLVSGLDHTDAPVLRGLIERGYTIAAVVSHHSASRSRKARPLEVAVIAEAHSIPVLLPNKPVDVIDQLAAMQADAAVLVAYGRIIPRQLIDLFPRGIINIHPSLLPKYRGPTPIETPLARGDSETGVSIMSLTSGMDEGPVYAQAAVPILPTDDKFTLYDKLARVSSDLLFDTLPSILDGSLTPTTQDHTKATYSHLLTKADGQLDPGAMTAAAAVNHVRAYLGFPGSRLTLPSIENDIDIIVTKAHVSSRPTSLSAQCSDGNYLAIDTLKPLGKKEMPVQAFLAGYGSRLRA